MRLWFVNAQNSAKEQNVSKYLYRLIKYTLYIIGEILWDLRHGHYQHMRRTLKDWASSVREMHKEDWYHVRSGRCFSCTGPTIMWWSFHRRHCPRSSMVRFLPKHRAAERERQFNAGEREARYYELPQSQSTHPAYLLGRKLGDRLAEGDRYERERAIYEQEEYV